MNPATSRIVACCLLIMAFVLVACSPIIKDSPKEPVGHNAAIEETSKKSATHSTIAKETSDEFAFEFKYGTNAKNVLDTFNGTFTRDMVVDKPIVVKLKLNKKSLKKFKTKCLKSVSSSIQASLAQSQARLLLGSKHLLIHSISR